MVENTAFARFARRILAAMARRAAGDVDFLPELVALRRQVDELIVEAVRGCREEGYSYGEIAARLGTSRQAVRQRYGVADDGRSSVA